MVDLRAASPPPPKNPPNPPESPFNPNEILHPAVDPQLPHADLPVDRSFPSVQGCGDVGASVPGGCRWPGAEPCMPGSSLSFSGASSPVSAPHVQFDASSMDSSGDEVPDGCASPFSDPLWKGKGELPAALDNARPPPGRRALHREAFMDDAR
jgi:hypothetical protein